MITNLPAILRGRAIKENVDMDELISKMAVIEAIEKARANVGHNLERSIGKSIIEILDDVGRDIDRLPPAEPEKRTEERTETHACDSISRQAAIDAINCDITITGRQNAELVAATIGAFVDRIKALPSAEPKIIRCKDCKWFNCIGCAIEIVDDSDKPTENDFCSFAERRTE